MIQSVHTRYQGRTRTPLRFCTIQFSSPQGLSRFISQEGQDLQGRGELKSSEPLLSGSPPRNQIASEEVWGILVSENTSLKTQFNLLRTNSEPYQFVPRAFASVAKHSRICICGLRLLFQLRSRTFPSTLTLVQPPYHPRSLQRHTTVCGPQEF